MTEHFTREEAVALAKAAGFEVRRGLGLRESVPEDVFARGLINEEVTALCNAAVTAIDKQREAQGAVAKAVVLTTGIGLQWIGEALPAGTKLFTHALPAQPAEPVNAELVSAAERVSLKYGHDDDGTPSDWTEWKDLREAISRAQAAPAVGVPDACVWTQDTDYETDIHYSACGEAWSFIEGGPKENKVRFCQGCGKPVKLTYQPKIGGV